MAWKIGKARGKRLRIAHNQFMSEFMHVPENNDGSSPPPFPDKTSQSDEIMVSFSEDNVGCLCISVVADAFSLFFIIT